MISGSVELFLSSMLPSDPNNYTMLNMLLFKRLSVLVQNVYCVFYNRFMLFHK